MYTYREANRDDFEQWFAMECGCFDRGTEWYDNARHEWDTLFTSGVFLTLVMENASHLSETHMVGFGGAAFVTNAFTRWIRTGQQPYTRLLATYPMPDGSWPLLSPNAIGEANAGEGLNLLFTHWDWSGHLMTEDEALLARVKMNERFAWTYAGYKFREILAEGFGQKHIDRTVEAGFDFITDYASYWENNPPAPPEHHRPYLTGITRSQALAKDGSIVCRAFLHTPPTFFFLKQNAHFCAWYVRANPMLKFRHTGRSLPHSSKSSGEKFTPR